MKRIRLTREQSRDQTRQRLLDAAQVIFMKKGFVSASVEDVAAAAGYTRGAFYSNFDSKDDLIIAIAATDVRTRVGPSNASDVTRPSYENFGKCSAGARPANWP